jgi:hypothetical protein
MISNPETERIIFRDNLFKNNIGGYYGVISVITDSKFLFENLGSLLFTIDKITRNNQVGVLCKK